MIIRNLSWIFEVLPYIVLRNTDKKVVSLIYTYMMPFLNPIWARDGIFALIQIFSRFSPISATKYHPFHN